VAERPAAARDVPDCNQPGRFLSLFGGRFTANQGAHLDPGRTERRLCHHLRALDTASAAASSRSRKTSINARTRAGMCVRVGKTAHIPISGGLTSTRTIVNRRDIGAIPCPRKSKACCADRRRNLAPINIRGHAAPGRGRARGACSRGREHTLGWDLRQRGLHTQEAPAAAGSDAHPVVTDRPRGSDRGQRHVGRGLDRASYYRILRPIDPAR
jgi:hypothetical protein